MKEKNKPRTLNLEQIAKKRNALNQLIFDAINKFENDTGLWVEYVNLENAKVDFYSKHRRTTSAEVRINIQL